MDSTTVAAAGLGVTLVLLLLFIRWRWRISKETTTEEECPPCNHVQLVHRLCPHHNVIQSFKVEQKDSLDEHLDVLTRKLAEKEGRLRLSKSKIRETQNEIENLQAINQDVRFRYREIMESLRADLLTNEKECKKLQEQIEWVSRKRAELREEVRRGQRLYGEAAAELASNLAELQRGRTNDSRVPDCRISESRIPDSRYTDPRYSDPRFTENTRITDKPLSNMQSNSVRHRKEPLLPRATPVSTPVIKTPPGSPDAVLSRANQLHQIKKKNDF